MRISNFGNIAKSSKKDFLKENYLSSEYEWGFELEGCVNSSLSYDSITTYEFLENLIYDYEEQYKNGDISKETYEICQKLYDATMNNADSQYILELLNNDSFKDEIWDYTTFNLTDRTNGLSHSEFEKVYDLIFKTFQKYISDGNWGKMTNDDSIKPDYEFDYTFEFATPHMPFKPSVIEDMIKFFKELDKTEFYVNDTCGFHIHLSYPNINKNDLIWVLCCLATNEKVVNMISYLEHSGIRLFKTGNDNYGTIDVINFIKNEIEEEDWFELGETLARDKQTLFRIHPQGTLEWRGPRNFLSSNEDKLNVENLYDLFKNLYRLTQFISSCLNKKFFEYNGKKYERKDVLKNILSQVGGIATNKFKISMENYYEELIDEVIRNGFNEDFLRSYLKDNKKILMFVNKLKEKIAEKGYNYKSILDNLTFDKIYNYFNKLTKKNILYPYKKQILDTLEINDPMEY